MYVTKARLMAMNICLIVSKLRYTVKYHKMMATGTTNQNHANPVNNSRPLPIATRSAATSAMLARMRISDAGMAAQRL